MCVCPQAGDEFQFLRRLGVTVEGEVAVDILGTRLW